MVDEIESKPVRYLRSKDLVVTIACSSFLLLAAGCTGSSPMIDSGSSVSLGDFSNTAFESKARMQRGEVDKVLVEAGLVPIQSRETTSVYEEELAEALDVEVRPGETVIVDSLIGQVNGRPIFADQILTPIMDQMNAEFARLQWPQFRTVVARLVSKQLQAVLYNELFLSEARAGMSEEQQTGFLQFMNDFRGIEIGKRGGIQAEAEQQMLEEEGKTIDEFMEQEEEKQLINMLINTQVRPNAIVSWRDVERAWDARQEEYNPKPTVTLGRIRLRTEGNEELIQLIQDQLDAGEPFNIVAAEAGSDDGGVWDTFPMGPGGTSDIEIADFYKEHLDGLAPGETSSAFTQGPRTIWISVIDILQPEKRTLFEPVIQQSLYRDIYSRRIAEAQGEFIDGILRKGIYDDIRMMEEKIVSIALMRFLARR